MSTNNLLVRSLLDRKAWNERIGHSLSPAEKEELDNLTKKTWADYSFQYATHFTPGSVHRPRIEPLHRKLVTPQNLQ